MEQQLPVSVLAFILATQAGLAPDAAAGRDVARVWCSACHVVERQAGGTGNDVVPSFSSLANTNLASEAELAAYLAKPHGGMVDYGLSRAEIRNLSAYIKSLRKP